MFKTLLLIVLPLATAGCLGTSAIAVNASGGSSARQANASRERIAVISFGSRAKGKSSEVGQGMADMLTDALLRTGRYIVLERDPPSGAAAVPGDPLDATQRVVSGTITRFESHCKGSAPNTDAAMQACVAVELRIIDAASGRVVSATTVQGTSAGGSATASGPGSMGGSLPIGLAAYRHTPMEQAIRACIESAVNYIAGNRI